MRLFGYLNSRYAEVYHTTEHVAVDKLIILFRGRWFLQHFGVYILHVGLGKQHLDAPGDMTPTYGTILQTVRHGGHWPQAVYGQLHLPTFFHSLCNRRSVCYGTIWHDKKGMPPKVSK